MNIGHIAGRLSRCHLSQCATNQGDACDCGALAATAPESKTADTPVAWAVFADNGNCRIWFSMPEPAINWAKLHDAKLTALYTHPATSHSADQVRDAAIKVLSFRDGELPRRGWLRDTDTSRAALQELADSILATSSAAKGAT